MILRTLAGEGPAPLTALVPRPLTTRQIFLAGARDLDPPEAAFIRDKAIDLTPPDALEQPGDLLTRIRRAGFSRVYLHVDVDVFDPAAFPDTLMRTPAGTTPEVVLAAIEALAREIEVAGLSLVEFCDRSGGRGIAPLRAIARAVVPDLPA